MQTEFKFRNYALPLAIILAALMLLIRPSHAATFTPTRFTIVDACMAGKPDVILMPGLNSSRSVWEAEAKSLATTRATSSCTTRLQRLMQHWKRS